ncbi:uncharacterized protein LOC120774624 [Bactrocera tryoni]|uniref:uncharacterized protein LOC120774624 n=1 Tax=Bactrocera tryoni TaxID=59916 RepID=UPI001A9A0EEE|nr:uncharacterized protein LOC120774624 [Bactrocera tryoni]
MTDPDSFLQCIIWRDKPNEDFRIFKLDTVTYGTKPASFLAIRSMQQLGRAEAHVYPVGAETIHHGFYVDDMITGAGSLGEAKVILNETKKCLSLGNFHLRKWCSNDDRVLMDIEDNDKQDFLTFDDGTSITKTLGLVWDPKLNVFIFSFSPFGKPAKVTKRTILSAIARLYDPLGLIGPVVAKAKIFLQHLWKEKLHWDESPPQAIQTEWLEICNQYKLITRFSFDRYLLMPEAEVQLHGFCDASEAAYGACIYIRAERGGHIRINLLCSKSRVAPLKPLTIPRLELCGALLLAELIAKVINSTHFKAKGVYCWSDSTTVLSWLRSEPANFNVFVANRINNIQTLTAGMVWSHVPTDSNPADVLSRGASPKELLTMDLWKYGPPYLGLDQSNWPKSPLLPTKDLPEGRKRAFVFISTIDMSLNCKFVNSFEQLQRVYAYVYRFSRRAGMRFSGPLKVRELQEGTFILIRMIQKAHLRDEYKALESKEAIKSSSEIRSLVPFLDERGLLRVGGRLQYSNLDFPSKHPIILPKRHPVTDAIISSFHWKLLHAGPQSLLASIRLQYWPIGGRKTVSRIINKCVRCFHVKPKLMEHLMGNLPSERVKCNRAFLTTGVDFCGPFFYKSDVRNRAPIKCYICIFICFATKAVHLELVKDLATSSFLAALKRFICKRGRPQTIWSDNATNFVGAKNELSELKNLFSSQGHLKMIHEQCASDQIE